MFNFKRLDTLRSRIGHPCEKLWPFKFFESFRCSISSGSIYYDAESDIRLKSYDHLNFSRCFILQFRRLDILFAWIGHPCEMLWPFKYLESFRCSISSVSIYYDPESDIRVKSYDHLNFSRGFFVQFRRLDILFAWIRHPCEMLWPFKFLESFRCSISSVSIYYDPESDILVKSYDHINSSRGFVLQFRSLDIFFAWIRHLSNKLWPYELAESFRCSISRVSIYYWPGSDIRVKRCGHLNFSLASMFNFEHLDISCAWIGLPSQKLWPFELALFFHV